MEAAELRELRALVERAGGRRAVLLVAEVVADGAPAAATLASFARELLGDEAPPGQGVEPGCRSRSRCRRRTLGARLLLVLCRGGTARGRGSRARLREMVRDVRGRLPLGPPPAVVGVLLPGGDGEDAAVLDAMLRRHFPAAGTVQAARYSPGSPAALRECRTAACRALRAALQHPEEVSCLSGIWLLTMGFSCGIIPSSVRSASLLWDLHHAREICASPGSSCCPQWDPFHAVGSEPS
uniref:C2orf72-like C-terminal domain-containing protein n=1 Tax=Gallus gallus TaxID=9031 RepID=A0A8V0YYR4_CHICK